MTVWTHSQGVFPLRAELVKALKMPAAAIRCIHVEGSGCYGHNGADDVALDAALLARAVPRQAGAAAMDARRRVRLGALWRGDVDERQGGARRRRQDRRLAIRGVEQHPLDAAGERRRHQCAGGLVSGRAAEAWRRRRPIPQPAGGGDRNAIPLYDFPSQQVVHHFIQDMPIRVSALRTLGAYANVFAIEVLHG